MLNELLGQPRPSRPRTMLLADSRMDNAAGSLCNFINVAIVFILVISTIYITY